MSRLVEGARWWLGSALVRLGMRVFPDSPPLDAAVAATRVAEDDEDAGPVYPVRFGGEARELLRDALVVERSEPEPEEPPLLGSAQARFRSARAARGD